MCDTRVRRAPRFAGPPRPSRFTGHNPSGDRLNGWLEATAAWRSPLHDITPFVQIGHATGSGHEFELLIALAHPLSPYHVPRHS